MAMATVSFPLALHLTFTHLAALPQGSWVNALVNGLFQVAFFAGYSIPEISTHMSDKYRSLWTVSSPSLPERIVELIEFVELGLHPKGSLCFDPLHLLNDIVGFITVPGLDCSFTYPFGCDPCCNTGIICEMTEYLHRELHRDRDGNSACSCALVQQ